MCLDRVCVHHEPIPAREGLRRVLLRFFVWQTTAHKKRAGESTSRTRRALLPLKVSHQRITTEKGRETMQSQRFIPFDAYLAAIVTQNLVDERYFIAQVPQVPLQTPRKHSLSSYLLGTRVLITASQAEAGCYAWHRKRPQKHKDQSRKLWPVLKLNEPSVEVRYGQKYSSIA